MKFFKGDDQEIKVDEVYERALLVPVTERNTFYDECLSCFKLGDIIHETKSAPLTNAIIKDIFRESFGEIFQAFIDVGSAEAYLTVFRKIFGESVIVVFTVPSGGVLNIDITAESNELYDFIVREIVDNDYVFHEIIDDELDNIAFQLVKGFKTQAELEAMLKEMVPSGIYTEITLTLDPEE